MKPPPRPKPPRVVDTNNENTANSMHPFLGQHVGIPCQKLRPKSRLALLATVVVILLPPLYIAAWLKRSYYSPPVETVPSSIAAAVACHHPSPFISRPFHDNSNNNNDNVLDNDDDDDSFDGFCQGIPRDLSTSYLWNTLLQRTQHLLVPTMDLRRHAVGRQPKHWKRRVLNALRQQPQQQQRTVKVWVLANPLDASVANGDSSWLQAVQDECRTWLGTLKLEWTVHAQPFATTDYYTHMLRTMDARDRPDVILHALSRHELRTRLAYTKVNPDTVQFEEERRFILQEFVRAAMQSSCQEGPPVVLFLDDHVPSKSEEPSSLWVQEVNSRMLQQVADYYDVGLISYAQLARRIAYAEPGSSVLVPDHAGNFHKLGHQAIASTILYALLDFTVSACQQHQQVEDSLLVNNETLELVAHTLPPRLNGNLSLITITQEWKQQQERIRQLCDSQTGTSTSKQCPSYYHAGGGTKMTQLGTVTQQEGVRMLPDGRLRVTTASATLAWSAPVATTTTTDSKLEARVFLVRSEDRVHNKDPSLLTWKLSSNGSGSSSTTTSGSYEITDSIGPGAVTPVTLELPSTVSQSVQVVLQVEHGSGVDIAGFFLCPQTL